MNIELVDGAFRKYVSGFDMDETNIYLKFEHTFQVVKIIEQIAMKMSLSKEEMTLAKVIAYLHDIGRFEQVVKTNTFKDNVIDHADNGIDLLFNRHLIDEFHISPKYYEIIRKAIKNHNKLEIEEDLNPQEELFVKLIRDADKIDIYRVRHKYEREKDEFNDVPTENNLNDFFGHRSINIKNNKTRSDSILCVLSFVYDMNFSESIEVLNESQYLQVFMDGIKVPGDKMALYDDIRKEINNYMNKKSRKCYHVRKKV